MAYRSPQPPSTTRKTTRGGLQALATSLPKVTARTLGRRGFAEGGLVNEWPAIVGAQIAKLCRPCSLSYPRHGRRHDGTLLLRVEPAYALEIQHMEPALLERINRYYGYRAVGRLKLRQSPLPVPKEPARVPDNKLAPGQEAALTLRLSDVKDPEMRRALERLGRSFLSRRRDPA